MSIRGPVSPALFSLNMLVGTRGGRASTQSELEAMLQKAGVKEVRRTNLEGPNQSGVLVGRV